MCHVETPCGKPTACVPAPSTYVRTPRAVCGPEPGGVGLRGARVQHRRARRSELSTGAASRASCPQVGASEPHSPAASDTVGRMDRLDPTAPYRRPELLALGYTDADLRTLRRRGHLTSLRRGCYLAGPAPRDLAARHRIQARAAFELLTATSTLCHASAAVLHGLPIWRMPLNRVHVVRAQGSGGRCHRQVHLWTAALTPSEIVLVDGLPVTSVARTLVDLARSVSFESALAAADAALARRLVTRTELDRALARAKGWRGCPLIRK